MAESHEVDKRYCAGCKYLKNLYKNGTVKFCSYYMDTGDYLDHPLVPEHCEKKQLKNAKMAPNVTD